MLDVLRATGLLPATPIPDAEGEIRRTVAGDPVVIDVLVVDVLEQLGSLDGSLEGVFQILDTACSAPKASWEVSSSV